MREIYKKNTTNYPRLFTDALFLDYSNKFAFCGFVDKAIKYIEDFQLLNPVIWARFVDQFKGDSDVDGGWRGEYWGKTMRGAAFVYSYTKNPQLYEIMKNTTVELMACADSNGRISSYATNHEFEAWDIWGRKYVLLGMQYFSEVCEEEELVEQIKKSMCAQMDYIMSKIGPREDGKKPITSATRHWRGLNSSSLLEPVVRLYNMTGETKYLDFATYIVNEGGMDVANVFDLAYENKLRLWQYPATKAYEMTSCFEGLLEYYRVTGIEKYKTSVVNFADAVLADEFTIIGTSGCTHELFDHSSVRQANTTNGIKAQETCVTVTLMKFFCQLTLLTGNPKYADAFEISLYNAYLGAINTDKVIEPSIKERFDEKYLEPLPFDSYSPLTAGTRGVGVGGLMELPDGHYYGCCACIGAAGIGIAAKMLLLSSPDGFAMNFYVSGEVVSTTPEGNKIKFVTDTLYPKSGVIKIDVILQKEEKFCLKLRNPAWSDTTTLTIDGESAEITDGYIAIDRLWGKKTTLVLELDMRTRALYPEGYGSQVLMNEVIWGYNYVIPTFDEEDPIARNHIALRRGPVILAQENRLGYSVDTPVTVKVNADGCVDATFPETDIAPYEHIVEVKIPLDEGEITLTDYASAGKLWNEESKMAAWILTKKPQRK